MARPCKVRIQIDGTIYDMQEDFGFHLMDSPNILVAPIRKYETEKYPERNGVVIYPYTTYEAFDYEMKFLHFGDENTTNAAIVDFYSMLFTSTSNYDLKRAKEITVFNDYKNAKIVGYIQDFNGDEDLYEHGRDIFIFDLTLYVPDPSKCVFK
ncbi:hypothetical protein PF672P1_00044 [Parabacteroides phage PF672P1]|nr:hypothetical protein PF672P1_00044 [Parabacteroides phage PF672P1]